MKVVNVHNRHAGAGGSEVMFESITALLRSRGHDLVVVERDNADLLGLGAKLHAFGSMIYSRQARREMASLLAREKPDVLHLHNIYPQISPSVIDAANEAGVPVVMSLHDYKLTCPTAQHLRNGKVCEKCLGGATQWCAIHNCRGSRAMSLAYAVRNAAARLSGSIVRGTRLFLCPSQFVADQHVRGGFPAAKMRLLPNFSDLPDAPPRESPGSYVAYVGRISPEKGIDVLIEASRRSGIEVRIAGDASAMPELQDRLPATVRFVGKLSRAEIPQFLRDARMLVVPSIWYEAFGLVCAEAMAYRLPVVASRIGGLPEVVEHGVTGLCVDPGNIDTLAGAMRSLWDDESRARAMGEAGRIKALREYTPDAYHQRLTDAYRSAIQLSEPDRA